MLKDWRILKTSKEYWSKNRVRRYYMLRSIRESRLAENIFDQNSGESFSEQFIVPAFFISALFLIVYMFSSGFGDMANNIFTFILGGILYIAAILMTKGVFLEYLLLKKVLLPKGI